MHWPSIVWIVDLREWLVNHEMSSTSYVAPLVPRRRCALPGGHWFVLEQKEVRRWETLYSVDVQQQNFPYAW